jgi:hypothetical protein
MIEISLVILFILLAVMLFFLLSLFIYLIIKKYANNQTRKQINEYKEAYRLDMFRYLQTGEQEILQLDDRLERFTALIELLSEYSNVLDDSELKERISIFAKQHLTKYIKKEIKRRRWSLRMNALYSIEDFHMDHLVETLHDLYKKRITTVSEKAQILKILADFNDDKIVEYIKNVDQSLSDFSLLSIIWKMKEKKFDELMADFDELSSRLQYMVIEVIGKKQLINHHALLQKLVMQNDEELRIRSLKAFTNTGIPINVKSIAAFFDSESWQIRMMTVKLVGVQRLDEYKEKLVELLSDREYIVRTEAAKAILRFKDGGSILTRVIEESNDVFAQDMAIEWLEKESGSYSY